MKLYSIIVIFILMNAFFIISQENLKLNSKENIVKFFGIYLSWFKNIGGNFKVLTGNVISQNWIPQSSNSTNDWEVIKFNNVLFSLIDKTLKES